jgi:hypothetical protein
MRKLSPFLLEYDLRNVYPGRGMDTGASVEARAEGASAARSVLWKGSSMPKKYRLQMDFSEDAYADLLLLTERTGITTKAGVIREALGVLQWLSTVLRNGQNICVRERTAAGDTTLIEVQFPSLTRRTPREP